MAGRLLEFKKKIKRANLLCRKRGFKWCLTSAISEIPLLPSIFLLLANSLSGLSPRWLVTLAGVHQNQLWHERREIIRSVCRRFFSKPVSALELGTWFGTGSTQIWMSNLAPGSSLLLVDTWKPFTTISDKKMGAAAARMDKVHRVAINSTLREVFSAERTKEILVSLVRADSASFLPRLCAHSFDLIYIDGSHYYEDAKRDIIEAKRLVRPNGMICGDDLDLFPSERLVKIARANIDRDIVILDDGQAFHPGVLLAVFEELPNVQMHEGFWWLELTVGAAQQEAAFGNQ